MREQVRFVSDSVECVGWHYPGSNGVCVVMAGGFGVTKEPATDLFAPRFQDAGYAVLAFDYRHLGESGGEPRQVARIGDQRADWRAAIEFAATLPGVEKVALWAFSLSGGYVVQLAAEHPRVAAAIAQSPNVDGPAAARNASRYQKPLAMLRFAALGIVDLLGGFIGRPPKLVALSGPPGTVALLTTPDSQDGNEALNPGDRYPDWIQAVAARSALRIAFYRAERYAARVRCPLLYVVCEQDRSALAAPAVAAANRTPNAELVKVPGGHYAPFLAAHEQVVQAELAFLRRHLLTLPTSTNQPEPRTAV